MVCLGERLPSPKGFRSSEEEIHYKHYIGGIRNALHEHYKSMWKGFVNDSVQVFMCKSMSHAIVMFMWCIFNSTYPTFCNPLLTSLASIPLGFVSPSPKHSIVSITIANF